MVSQSYLAEEMEIRVSMQLILSHVEQPRNPEGRRTGWRTRAGDVSAGPSGPPTKPLLRAAHGSLKTSQHRAGPWPGPETRGWFLRASPESVVTGLRRDAG